MKVSRKKRQFFIASVDTVLLFLAIFMALLIRWGYIPSLNDYFNHFIHFLPVVFVWVIALYVVGLYSLEIPYVGYRILSRIFFVALLCMLFGFAFFYLNLEARIVPKTILVLYSIIAGALISSWRYFFNNIAVKYLSTNKIAFIGINDAIIDLLQNAKKFSYMSYTPVFFFADDGEEHSGGGGGGGHFFICGI
jgi:FlaA1/EpsC-like NDP-sugar epimerase